MRRSSLTLCVQNIAHKNEALPGYVSPRVGPRELYRLEIALKIIITVPTFTGTKSGITLLIFTLEQKLKVHWNGLQKTFLLSYYTSKSEQAENSLVLPTQVSTSEYFILLSKQKL